MASDQPQADFEIHPMVLNIGRRPTVEADSAAAITVEAHIMHTFAAGFYGRHCRALVSGFIRYAPDAREDRVCCQLCRESADCPLHCHCRIFKPSDLSLQDTDTDLPSLIPKMSCMYSMAGQVGSRAAAAAAAAFVVT